MPHAVRDEDRRSRLDGRLTVAHDPHTLAAVDEEDFVFLLVEVDADEADAGRHAERRPDAYSLTLAAGLAVFVSLVLWLVRVRTDPASLVEFVVPSAGLAALVGWRVVPSGRGQARARCTRLWSLVAPVVAGAVAPIALFLIPFVVTGSVGDFIRGTFVLPPQRLAYAAGPPMSASSSSFAS